MDWTGSLAWIEFLSLTYTSTNPPLTEISRIQVALDRSGYQLDFRRGYYADDGKSTQAPLANRPPRHLLSPFLRRPAGVDTLPLTLRVTGSVRRYRVRVKVETYNLKGALTRYSVT